MTNGIGPINGGNNYGVGNGYVPPRNDSEENVPQAPVNNYDDIINTYIKVIFF